MPIYEYRCKNCGHHLEAIQGFDDKPLTKCPECKKAKLEKLVSAPAFHLKGTGWYATDFKNSGKKSELTNTTETKPKEKTTESTDTKTATVKETKKEDK